MGQIKITNDPVYRSFSEGLPHHRAMEVLNTHTNYAIIEENASLAQKRHVARALKLGDK